MVAKLVLYQSDGQVLMDNSALPFFQWKFVHAASHHREDQTMSSREKSPMIKRNWFEPEKSSFRKARHFFLGTGSKNCLELETEDSSSSAEILIRVSTENSNFFGRSRWFVEKNLYNVFFSGCSRFLLILSILDESVMLG